MQILSGLLEHSNAFEKFKYLICIPRPFWPTLILPRKWQYRWMHQAEALEHGKPVAFANIKRELLAVVFGCDHFHTYIYGNYFTVESDHKPLEMIQRKSLKAAPAYAPLSSALWCHVDLPTGLRDVASRQPIASPRTGCRPHQPWSSCDIRKVFATTTEHTSATYRLSCNRHKAERGNHHWMAYTPSVVAVPRRASGRRWPNR